MFFIIFGFVERTTPIGRGNHHCDTCNSDQAFVTIERRRWLHLFRVPVLKRDVVAVLNECAGCHRTVEFY